MININWLRHEQIIADVNILIKSAAIDPYQCSQSTMEIVVCLTDRFSLRIISFFIGN